MMGQVQATVLYYMIRGGGHPLLNAKMSSYEAQSAGHLTQAPQTRLDFIRVTYADDFPPTNVLPIWAGMALLLPKSAQHSTPASILVYPNGSRSNPHPRRRSAGTPLPPLSCAMGCFTQDEAPQSRFMGLR